MKCPNCDSIKLSWDSYQVTTIPPIGSSIPAPKLVLGCDECSETVKSVDLDAIADLLNRLDFLFR